MYLCLFHHYEHALLLLVLLGSKMLKFSDPNLLREGSEGSTTI